MRARLLMVALAGLTVAGASAAEPAKAPVRKAEQPAEQPAPVLVAAADQVRAQPTAEPQPQAAAPVKRRAARVSTCRCGGQDPSN
jgi:hypothetical protein